MFHIRRSKRDFDCNQLSRRTNRPDFEKTHEPMRTRGYGYTGNTSIDWGIINRYLDKNLGKPWADIYNYLLSKTRGAHERHELNEALNNPHWGLISRDIQEVGPGLYRDSKWFTRNDYFIKDGILYKLLENPKPHKPRRELPWSQKKNKYTKEKKHDRIDWDHDRVVRVSEIWLDGIKYERDEGTTDGGRYEWVDTNGKKWYSEQFPYKLRRSTDVRWVDKYTKDPCKYWFKVNERMEKYREPIYKPGYQATWPPGSFVGDPTVVRWIEKVRIHRHLTQVNGALQKRLDRIYEKGWVK